MIAFAIGLQGKPALVIGKDPSDELAVRERQQVNGCPRQGFVFGLVEDLA